MFGVLAVYQVMLPLLRESSDARIVNVSSGVGSLTTNADPAYSYHAFFGPIYPASKTALNAVTLAMVIELESTDIKVNLVSPGFTSTNLNGYAGTESVEDGSREVVRVFGALEHRRLDGGLIGDVERHIRAVIRGLRG